jgi:selenocysteine lyase/cysteine desulfurase
VCFLADDAAGLAGRLAALRVLVWGGEGRIRVSPHVHCDRDDVERFFEALDRVGARPGPALAAR